MLAAAGGVTNAAIATELGLCVDTARRWRRRFATERMQGLTDRPRTGRPRRFTAETVAAITALACTLPAETGIPLSRWSSTDLAAEGEHFDLVTSNHVLYHLSSESLAELLADSERLAPCAVHNDIERSRLAYTA